MKYFSTKYRELIITVDPKTFTVESGMRVTKGLMGLYPQGLSIYFKNREFDTKDLRMTPEQEKRLVQVLRRHPAYGVSFIAQDHEEDDEVAEKKARAEAEKAEAAQKAADTNHDKPVNKPAK